MHILLAEDDPVNESVARKLVENLGHTCRSVRNGLEVLAALREDEVSSFDCILMDLQMPEMDGLEATRRILAEHPVKDDRPRIIAVTANAFKSDRDNCLAAGMDGFLTKPLRMEDLRRALDGSEPESPDAAAAGEIDFERFDSLMGEGDEVMAGIFHDFCAQIPALLKEMEEAVGAKDTARLAALAHRVKGSTSTFGLDAFGRRMSEVQKSAEANALASLEEGWPARELAAFEESVAALRKRL